VQEEDRKETVDHKIITFQEVVFYGFLIVTISLKEKESRNYIP